MTQVVGSDTATSRPDEGPGVAPPDVLLLAPELVRTGAGVITMALARRWAGHGARLAVLLRVSGVPQVEVPDGVAVQHLTRREARVRWVLPGALGRAVLAARRSAVVLACSEIGLVVPLGYLAARLARRPFVVAVHADLDEALTEWTAPRLRPVLRWVHRHVDGAVVVEAALAAPLVRNGLDPSRVRLVVNGIDPDAVRAAGAGPGSLVVADGTPTVVATGRLAPQKAHEVLLEAHARLVAELPHRVLLLGDGPDRAALERLAARLGVAGSVVFAGAVTPVLPSVAAADVFCLPSRHEGLPLALLEALALGVPCVATASSAGVRAALDGGRVGDLVPVDDVAALTAALRRHLVDPAPLRAKAALGPRRARDHDLAAMADGWATALRDLAGQPRTAQPRK